MHAVHVSIWVSVCVVEEEEEDEMEKMLSELTLISPPSSAPVLDSLHSEEGGSESGNSLDSLALMKKRLLDTMESDKTSVGHKAEEEESATDKVGVSSPTAISIEPPTPTTPSQQKTLAERTNPTAMGSLLGDSLKSDLSEDDLLPSTSDIDSTDITKESTLSAKKSPFFTPASLQNSPSSSDTVRVALVLTWAYYDVL